MVTWDSDAETDARDFFVNQATPEGIGQTLMDNAARVLGGKGSFAIITASLTAANMISWQKTIEARRLEKYPQITMASLRPCDDLQKKAFDETNTILNANPDVKVIILTVYSDDALVEESIKAGARGYIIKDIERFELKQAIRAVCRGEAVVSPQIAGKLLDRVRTQLDPAKTAAARPALNEKQAEILRLISEGFSNREIAGRIHLSENTVKSHLQEIFSKLEVRNRVEAAVTAARKGLI